MAADYDTLVYTEVGGSKLVVASGGELEVQSGGTLDIQDGATFNVDVLTVTDTITVGADGAGHDVTFYGDTASSYLLYDADTCSLLLPGAVSKFKLGAFSGATTGSGSALSSTNTAAFRVYADDGEAAIGSGQFVRAGVFRHLQTYTGGNREQEAAGVVGQIVSSGGTNRHNMCGVMGSYEARGTVIVDGQAAATDTWCQAGVIGRVGAGSAVTLTLNTNGILAGLAAMSNINSSASATYTGEYCGVYVGAWATTDDFEIGLLIEDGKTTTGIDVGSCTTGLLLGGTITTGISVTSASLTDGIKISGTTPVDGLEISSACSAYGINISDACTTAGIFLSTTNKLMFHDTGMYMRASADGHLEIVSDDTITLSSPGHGSIVFGGETDWGAGSTGHDIDGSGWDWVTQTVGHVDSGALATACAAAYNALSVTTTSHTSTSSFFGTWTELYFVADCVLTGASNAAAVWGQVEGLGALTSPDSGDFVTGGYFNVKTGGLLALTDGSNVSGVRVKGEINSKTGTGILSAFSCTAVTTDWAYGVYLEAIETGIYLGACDTAGIHMVTGQVTGINVAGTCSTAGISMGALSTGGQAMLITWSGVPSETASADAAIVSVTGTATADDAAGDQLIGYYANLVTSTADQPDNYFVGFDALVESKHNIDRILGVRSEVKFNDNAGTVDTGSAAVYAICNVADTVTVSAGPVSAVWAHYNGAAAVTTAETSCFFGDIDQAIDKGLDFDVANGITCTTGIELGGTGTGAFTTGIKLSTASTNYIDFANVGTTSAVALHFVAAFLGHSIETGTYQSTADGGVILDSTNTFNAAFLADDSGSNIGVSARNLLARTLLTTSQSGGSIRSAMGQLKLLDAVDLATGVYTGVQGYIELVGDTTISSGAKASGMDISIEVASAKTLTIASGGIFAGLKIETTGAGTIANSGDCAAIYIDDGGTVTDWPVGIDINNCTTGIDIGACTTGINLTGDMTTGINIASTCSPTDAIKVDCSTATRALFVTGSPLDVFKIEGTSSTRRCMLYKQDLSSRHEDANDDNSWGIYLHMTHGIDAATAHFIGYASYLCNDTGDVFQAVNLEGSQNISSGVNRLAGLHFEFNVTAASSASGAAWGDTGMRYVGALLRQNPANTQEGEAAIAIDDDWNAGIWMDPSELTHALKFQAAGGCMEVNAADVAGTATSHALRIDIAGTDYWIPVYDTKSW